MKPCDSAVAALQRTGKIAADIPSGPGQAEPAVL
jgi:hypothetical protein